MWSIVLIWRILVNRRVIASAGAVVVGLAAALSAAPAQATVADRTLPAGDTLYALGCDNDMLHSLYTVDTSSGALTPVGEPRTDGAACWMQPFVDRESNMIVAIDWYHYDPDGNLQLSYIDPATGEVTAGATLHTADNQHPWLMSLAQAPDGTVYGVESTANFIAPQLYTVELATGLLTPIGQTYRNLTDFESRYWALAWDPNTDQLVGFAQAGSNRFTSLDVTTAMATVISTADQTLIMTMAFDSSGVPWVGSGYNTISLGSGDLVDFGAARANTYPFTLNGTEVYVDALAIVHEDPVAPSPDPSDDSSTASLAATGAGASPAAALALITLVAGGALIAVRRARRAN